MSNVAVKHVFTKKYIESLPTKDKEYTVWDLGITGFGCRVSPKGRKTYTYVYYNTQKKLVKITIGQHGLTTVEMARKKVQNVLSNLQQDIDPREEKKKALEDATRNITFKDFWAIFDERHIQKNVKQSTKILYKRLYDNHIFPFFHKMRMADISQDDIYRFKDKLSHIKPTLNNVLMLLKSSFKLAEIWGYRDKGTNPLEHIIIPATNKKERFLTDEEYTRLEQFLDAALMHSNRSKYVIKAIQLLLYTGCRESEIAKLRWDEVNLNDNYLYLKEDIKKDRSIKTGTRTVPLNDQAKHVLQTIERKPGNPHVFVGKYAGTCVHGLRAFWHINVQKKLGLNDVRLHDLRHSFASFALKSGVDLYTVSKLLGHKNINTTTRYAHLDISALKNASNKIFASKKATNA